MANKHTSLTSLFTNIADAIRSCKKSTDPIRADDFPDAIEALSTDDATAQASDILTGKTAYADGKKVTGKFDTSYVALDEGNNVSIPTSVRNNSTESYQYITGALGDAAANEVLKGAGFTTNEGVNQLGTMVNNGTVNATLNCGDSYTIPNGYHRGNGKVTAKSLASQTSATATAREICLNKTAYVNGKKITGTGLIYNHKTAHQNDVSAFFNYSVLTDRYVLLGMNLESTNTFGFFCGWVTITAQTDSGNKEKQVRFGGVVTSDGTITGSTNGYSKLYVTNSSTGLYRIGIDLNMDFVSVVSNSNSFQVDFNWYYRVF